MHNICNLKSRRELFVDDWLIEKMSGAELKLHSPVPQETVLVLDRPWEGTISYDPVVMKDGERFRMWYRGAGEDWEAQVTCYAESSDGIHWARPELGIFEFDGSEKNNIVLKGEAAKALCVFRDGNPDVPEEERYKGTGIGPKIGDQATWRGFVSPDGLHWELIDPDPLLLAPADDWPWFDSHNISFWDSEQKQYVGYLRGWLQPGVRAIRRSISSDFRSWSELEFIDVGDGPLQHLYKNSCTQYFRAPHIYLMFPKRFVPERRLIDDWDSVGISEAVFMSSRDGIRWDRRFLEAFLRPGLDQNNWTDRNMYIGPTLIQTGPAELSLYYMEHYKHPTCRLRRGTLRLDGFVSVNARWAGGEFVTHPLSFEGSELVINHSTSAAGSIRVEVQNEDGRPLDGFAMQDCQEIFGDEIERVVDWGSGSGLGALAGKTIRLRFAMQDADLYAVQFRG